MHAGVELEPYRYRLAQARLLDSVQLPGRMYNGPQVMLDNQRQLVGLEKTFEQQDGRTDTCRTQL
ncbi:hypothetical protein PSYPI_26664 [Pseudomonas syringae pv. pisi str. 1704B]|uniref:Uncharacterized protein n=1 Tax=Pseudomonas syringae pv. pisi str. 1704B TaxID=629263 RepID=F3GF43_PSESJ|nr:hypothetical protein PSYPI_26664 [Pseudomonas syringae pv. pisi str. 1704B]